MMHGTMNLKLPVFVAMCTELYRKRIIFGLD
jgi:hypothetical protein